MIPQDAAFMVRALELARCGDARVEPNPRVGAVLVRDGRIVGEGFHPRAGEPHAEVLAILAAGAAARGATLYVTLEPCNHTGRTPPCTEAILAAGIARVVAARRDPNRTVEGRGVEFLRARGVETDTGLLEGPATRLIAPFLKIQDQGLPHVTLKWAMSLDGRIATRTRDSRWLTSEETRSRARRQRAQFGAILVGAGTALLDDPLLTSADPSQYTPLRVVLDSQARLPLDGRLVRTAREHPLLVAVSPSAPTSRVDALEAASCGVVRVTPDAEGRPAPRSVLEYLARRGVHSVLVEGGAGVAASFLGARLVDEVHLYLAPLIVGGANALSPVGGEGAATLAEALRAHVVTVEKLGPDVFVRALL